MKKIILVILIMLDFVCFSQNEAKFKNGILSDDEIISLGGNKFGTGGDVGFNAFVGETSKGIRVLNRDEYLIPFLGSPHIEGQGNLGAGIVESRAGGAIYIETAKYNFTTDDQIPYGAFWLRRAGKAMTSIIAKSKDEASSHISSRLKVGYTPIDNYGNQSDMNTLSIYGNTHSQDVITTDASRESIENAGLKALVNIDYLKTGNITSPDVKFSRVFGYGNASGNHFVASFDGTVLGTNATRTTFNGSDQITGQGNLGSSTYYSGFNMGVTTNSSKKTIDDQIPVAIFWASQNTNEAIKPVEIIAHENKEAGASAISSRLQIGYPATSAGADQTNMNTLDVNGNAAINGTLILGGATYAVSNTNPDFKAGRVFGYGNLSGTTSTNCLVAAYDGSILATDQRMTILNGSDEIRGQGNLSDTGNNLYAGVELYNTVNSQFFTIADQIPVGQIVAIRRNRNNINLIAHPNKNAGASQINSRLQIGFDQDIPNQSNMNTLDVDGNVNAVNYTLKALNVAPSSSTDTGVLGEIRYTSDYIYICIATNTWKRSPISTW